MMEEEEERNRRMKTQRRKGPTVKREGKRDSYTKGCKRLRNFSEDEEEEEKPVMGIWKRREKTMKISWGKTWIWRL
jgi:hypothetical protein